MLQLKGVDSNLRVTVFETVFHDGCILLRPCFIGVLTPRCAFSAGRVKQSGIVGRHSARAFSVPWEFIALMELPGRWEIRSLSWLRALGSARLIYPSDPLRHEGNTWSIQANGAAVRIF